jgi:hypothetical protein
MQVSPQRAAIRAEQGSQGLKKFDQANYQNRQATMQQAQQGMDQLSRQQAINEAERQGVRRVGGNEALKQYDQDIYRQNQNPMQFAVQPSPEMPANSPYRQASMQEGLQAQQAGLNQAAQQAAQRMSQYGQGTPANVVGGLGSGIAAGLGGQAYAGGNPNFDERTGQFTNRDPGFSRGPDRMGMPQAYPDRIADPMRPQGDRGPLTRLSPGVYRNTQGQLTGPGGRVMPNQPNRNPAQGYATDMYNNMVQQPGYPNGKGPARDVYSPMGSGGYDLNQAQNPIYRSIGSGYNLPQNTNVMPGYTNSTLGYSPYLGSYRGR